MSKKNLEIIILLQGLRIPNSKLKFLFKNSKN